MKKVMALLLAMLFLIMCSACSKQEDSSKSADSGTAEPVVTAKASKYASVTIGDTITFGSYEQDNNLDNGPEPIEWMVLDIQDGKAFLLSRYGLDTKPYNTVDTDITWEACSLRRWMNSDFIDAAFSKDEQSAILITEVDNSDAQGCSRYIIYGGNNTQDKTFLLSFSEANRYLGVKHWTEDDENNKKSRVAPTEYAIQAGADAHSYDLTADGEPAGAWWLRSPGELPNSASDVFSLGRLGYGLVNLDGLVVRPALWLDLNAAESLK